MAETKRRVTLKEVAKQTGVSLSAVSQILNNKAIDFSSEETKQKVLKVAKDLGYRQHFRHKLIRGENTKTVALILSIPRRVDEEPIQKLLNCLNLSYNEKGYSTYINRLSVNANNNEKIISELVERGVESFIFIGVPVNFENIFEKIESFNRKWICYGGGSNIKYSVTLNTAVGIEKIVLHLLKTGVKNFKLIHHGSFSDHRYLGLKSCFPELNDDEIKEKYICHFDSINDTADNVLSEFDVMGEKLTDQILKEEPNIQAIIYFSDYYLTGGIRSLLKHNKIIGKDVIIAGVNNIHAIRTSPYPLITLEANVEEIANLLIQNVTNKDPLKINVFHDLIIKTERN